MGSDLTQEKKIFFNQQFDKKRLKALISWVFKQSGEAKALRVVDLLKETGFKHATKAGISIGLHDLTTPIQKSWLISESQLSIATTQRDFVGARITATERSQRIVDTWHRASESLSKQVVDYFAVYDRFNPVYIMALSGARGNFSQVRQLVGMRGLMADQQGKIVSFPIRSNLREGLTLTEYFISCSGARKGLVDTALRTADTGYLTRRLVDVSHHVIVKRIRCNTNRGIAFTSLQSYNKVLLPLKERLVGRVLAEDIFLKNEESLLSSYSRSDSNLAKERSTTDTSSTPSLYLDGSPRVQRAFAYKSKICMPVQSSALLAQRARHEVINEKKEAVIKRDQEVSLKLALKIAKIRDKVELRSPLTCGFTHGVCQLCYGWSISQGSLVSLGDAVGVIAAQSIGEPGTQLTMRTFHTGGVFSGDLLQEIRAPHRGRVAFSKAFQGLLIRTAHGRIAFLSKTEGSLLLSDDTTDQGSFESEIEGNKPKKSEQSTVLFSVGTKGSPPVQKNQKGKKQSKSKSKRSTTIFIPPFTMLFVRQGEQVENNQLLAEFSIRSKEGNQPIKTQQTVFSELSGRVVEDCSGKDYTRSIKEPSFLLDSLDRSKPILEKRANSCLCPHHGFLACKASNSPYKTLFCTGCLFAKQAIPLGTTPYKYKALLTSCRAVLKGQAKRSFAQASNYKSSCRVQRASKAELCTGIQSRAFYTSASCTEGDQNTGTKFLTCPKGTQSFVLVRSFVRKRICKKICVCTPSFVSTQLPHKILHNGSRLNCKVLHKLCKKKRRRGDDALSRFCLQSTDLSLRQNRCLNIPHSVQNKRLQKIVDKGLRTQGISGKRAVFLNRSSSQSIKKKESIVCKAQPLSVHKGEGLENDVFKHIEPIRSGRLGFLKVLSTRVGATLDYMSPAKSFDIGFKEKQVKVKTDPPHLHEEEKGLFFLQARTEPSYNYKASRALWASKKICKAGTPAFCRYLHPEVVKTNRFVLQTVAEYGDVVEEGYSVKKNPHLSDNRTE